MNNPLRRISVARRCAEIADKPCELHAIISHHAQTGVAFQCDADLLTIGLHFNALRKRLSAKQYANAIREIQRISNAGGSR